MKRLLITAILIAFATIGCANAKPIDELAIVTAANVSVVGSSLSRFADDAKLLAEDRARALQNLSNQLDRSNRQLVEDLFILKKIGADDSFRMLETLIGQSREVHSFESRADSDELIDEIMNQYESLQIPSETLASLAETLATLGERRATRDQVRFFALFATQVKEDIDNAIAQHDNSNADARHLLDVANVEHRRQLSDAPGDN